MWKKPALDPNNSGNNRSVSNLLFKVKRINQIIESTPSSLTSANSLNCLQLISKGKQHPDYLGGIADRTDGCLWEARGQSDKYVGGSNSLGMSSSTLLGDTIFGI